MLLGCHNVIMSNHSTFVLSYLILQGYDVSGYSWMMRTAGLFVGMLLCMAVFYKIRNTGFTKENLRICSTNLIPAP